jgi:hypothetical protein
MITFPETKPKILPFAVAQEITVFHIPTAETVINGGQGKLYDYYYCLETFP